MTAVAPQAAGAATKASADAAPRPSPPLGLYVHFPFCLSICPYCDFVVVAGKAASGRGSQIAAFVDAVEREIGLRVAAARATFGRQLAPLASVYLGGGTPSLLSPAQVERLLTAVGDGFGLADAAEVTLEVNPGAADRGDLAGFRAAGVNRLSIGAQSMDPAALRRLGRRHAPADVADTVGEARRSGFDNVSLDLLYDVPGQTLASWRSTLHAALALAPDHLSAYSLTLDDPDAEGLAGPLGDHLPARDGARRWRARARAEQDDDRAAEMYVLADELLEAAGLCWYEISNWARPGRESRHNLGYWQGTAWEAVGPGGHAFDGARSRRWNAARLDAYVAALAAGRLPPGAVELADERTAAAERSMLQLRTRAGLDLERAAEWPALVDRGLAGGLLEPVERGGLRLTRTGRLLSSELLLELTPA